MTCYETQCRFLLNQLKDSEQDNNMALWNRGSGLVVAAGFATVLVTTNLVVFLILNVNG
jgi:hypothetical protein